jgi:chromosome segregation ATPase
MQSWHRARKYPLAFPGSAEAWLGMARGYDESGLLGRAGEAYLAAASAFESELVTLQELTAQVQEKGGYRAMIQAAEGENIEWFLAASKTLNQPRLAYLMQFMRDPQFQQAVRQVAELDETARTLKAHSRDLVVLATMLQQRLDSFREKKTGELQGLGQRIAQLEQRALDARARLAEASEEGDATEVVSGELARQLKSVQALSESGELSAEEAKRQQRLEGVLKWEAQEQFENAQRQLNRTLDGIEQSLAAARQSRERFESRMQDAPDRFAELLQRVRDAQDEVDQTLRATKRLRQRSEETLNAQLISFLEKQSRQVEAHLDRSDQQLAHLYEHLAMKRAKLGEGRLR